MPTPDAGRAGTFKVGGEIEINRLGYGAMRVTGEGIWGEPEDRAEALRTLRRLPELGVNFIDTADSYGPDISEQLIREALHPYDGLLIATKGGLARTGPGGWEPLGRPEYLIQQAKKSCRQLGVERIDLWQLHRIDPAVPREEQFEAIAGLVKEGVIRFVGLSQVRPEEIKAAREYFPVATVQNRYNLIDRSSAETLQFCEKENIGFIPWFPLAAGDLAHEGSILDRMAKKYGAKPSQLALAWVLKSSPVALPIPGTSKVRHLEENVAAAALDLSDEDFATLDREGREAENKAA